MTTVPQLITGPKGNAGRRDVPTNALCEMVVSMEGDDEAYIAYVVPLDFKGARVDIPGATHEFGVSVVRGGEMLNVFTVQAVLPLRTKLKRNSWAVRCLLKLVEGVLHGHLPIGATATEPEVRKWAEQVNFMLVRWSEEELN